MTKNLYLREKDQRQLRDLLARFLPEVSVWVYGSRINGTAHEASDLDIVLRSSDLSLIPILELEDFLQAVKDSTIPILIEARDWARLPASFHQEILKNYVVFKDAK